MHKTAKTEVSYHRGGGGAEGGSAHTPLRSISLSLCSREERVGTTMLGCWVCMYVSDCGRWCGSAICRHMAGASGAMGRVWMSGFVCMYVCMYVIASS